MKASITNCCSALVFCQLLLGANQGWSSEEKKDFGKEQKVCAKTVQERLEEMENNLSKLSKRIDSLSLDLWGNPFRNLVDDIRVELYCMGENLKGLNDFSEATKKMRGMLNSVNKALEEKVEAWSIRDKEVQDWLMTGSRVRPTLHKVQDQDKK